MGNTRRFPKTMARVRHEQLHGLYSMRVEPTDPLALTHSARMVDLTRADMEDSYRTHGERSTVDAEALAILRSEAEARPARGPFLGLDVGADGFGVAVHEEWRDGVAYVTRVERIAPRDVRLQDWWKGPTGETWRVVSLDEYPTVVCIENNAEGTGHTPGFAIAQSTIRMLEVEWTLVSRAACSETRS